jgi:pimeloyl-ACP methyl ester carboxylesterase
MSEHVLFVHSTGTSPAMWRAVPSEALGGRAPLTPANLGYPPSPPLASGEKVTADDEIDHLLRAIPEGEGRIHVVAHSYGATIALRLAERPAVRARLGSMFLAEPVLFGALMNDDDGEVAKVDPEAVASARAAFHPGSPFFVDEHGGRAAWLEHFIDYWNRPGSWAKLPDVLKQQALAVGWKMYQEVRICAAEDRPFREWRIDVPTTIVFGERTTNHARAMTRALERTHHGADLVVVEMKGTGHMAPLTHPQLVAAEIGRHFARLLPGGSTNWMSSVRR